MNLETNVFTFKICFSYEAWAAVYDTAENVKMNKELGIICLYKSVKEGDSASTIHIKDGEESKSIAMFKTQQWNH